MPHSTAIETGSELGVEHVEYKYQYHHYQPALDTFMLCYLYSSFNVTSAVSEWGRMLLQCIVGSMGSSVFTNHQ